MNRRFSKGIEKLRELEKTGEINRIDSVEVLAEKLEMPYKPSPEVKAEQKRYEQLKKDFRRLYNGVSVFYNLPYRIN